MVGGGVIGACCALELQRAGARVTLLERGPELAWGCSAGNAGLIHHSVPLATPANLRNGLRWMLTPDSPFYLRLRPGVLPWLARFAAACTPERAAASARILRSLSASSLAHHAAYAAEGLGTGFERQGTILVYLTDDGLAAGRDEARGHATAGVRSEILTTREAKTLEPALADGFAGAVYYPDEAHCEPAGFVHAIGRAAAEAGAEIQTRVEVISLRTRGGRVASLQTTAGEVAAETVVLAAGAWTARLAATVGVFCPLEGGKGYHVDVEAAAADPRIPVYVQESRVIATPLPGRLRLSGTLELAGLDLSVDERRVEAIVRGMERALPGLGSRPRLETWRGLRPCTPDGLPVIGRAPEAENLVLATGHAMMGLTLAPATARLVAGLVAGVPALDELAPFRPERFRAILGL